MLGTLADLKLKEEEAEHNLALLKQPGNSISAFDLLTLMFGIVSNAMNKPAWRFFS